MLWYPMQCACCTSVSTKTMLNRSGAKREHKDHSIMTTLSSSFLFLVDINNKNCLLIMTLFSAVAARVVNCSHRLGKQSVPVKVESLAGTKSTSLEAKKGNRLTKKVQCHHRTWFYSLVLVFLTITF